MTPLDAAWALQQTGIAMTELFTTGGRTLYPATKAVMNHLGDPGGGHMRAVRALLVGKQEGGISASASVGKLRAAQLWADVGKHIEARAERRADPPL